MRIKSYFAESVQQAIERARLELGPDAMLMNSRKTDPELKHLGAYEVVFGLANANGNAKTPKPAENTPPAPEPVPTQDPLLKEIAELRRQIETVKRSVSRQNLQQQPGYANALPELEDAYNRLLAAEFSEEIAQEIIQAVETRLTEPRNRRFNTEPRTSASGLQTALANELESRFQVAPGLASADGGRKVIAFIGPPAAGKTTSIAKLAMKYGLASQSSVQILSTDTLRIGGSEQLGAYARILGVGFQAVHSPAGLEQAFEEHRNKKLILIDTPGYDSKNLEESRELVAFISRDRNLEVHLVMPAVMRSSSALRVYERFAPFKPSKLLFTHVDDAEMPASILELAFRTGLPISYLANGQGIPEDIEEASKLRLTEKLFAFMRWNAQSAA